MPKVKTYRYVYDQNTQTVFESVSGRYVCQVWEDRWRVRMQNCPNKKLLEKVVDEYRALAD